MPRRAGTAAISGLRGLSGGRPSVVSAAAALRVLGLDPGTRVAGYGVVERARGGALRYVECGTIRLDTAQELGARLAQLARAVEEIVAELRPDCVALERAYAGRNVASALTLGEARGALKLVVHRLGLPLCEYAPAAVKKKAVLGHGRGSKRMIQSRVAAICGLPTAPAADAADAVAIAFCHLQGLGVMRRLAPTRPPRGRP
jgi:crossover junction endodeoxyribonuclease RuvC